jgi:hypothetical protein
MTRISTQRVCGVLAGLALTGSSPAGAQGVPSFDGPFAVDQALALIYGGTEWDDPRLLRYTRFGGERAFVEPLFDASYVEDGVEKHVVIATLTPQPRSQYACHACSPLLGGAVFRSNGGSWTVEAAGPILEFGHAWYGTHSWLELVRIGPDRFGLRHRIADMHGGYEDKSASLIFASDGELAVRFAAPAISGPGPGACGIPGEQHLGLTADEPDEADERDERDERDEAADDRGNTLFDILVDARWNDARCRMIEDDAATFEGQVCHRVTRYRHTDGAYELVATELDECTPLPEGVIVSFRG